jgi:hypothetical protein
MLGIVKVLIKSTPLLLFAISVNFVVCAQDVSESDDNLARALSHATSRRDAEARILTAGSAKLPLLLAWTKQPPAGIHDIEFYFGLAEVLGRMKAKEAIPFLVQNIGLNTFPFTDAWTRSPKTIEERLPAVIALIQIGPDASRAVMAAYPKYTEGMDRLAAIFTVSRIAGVPEARGFLVAVLGQANQERYWADEGLIFSEGNNVPQQ